MTTADIIALVEKHPDGLTTAQAAQITGMTPAGIATRLSRLASYGKIARRRITVTATRRPANNASTWLPKQERAAS